MINPSTEDTTLRHPGPTTTQMMRAVVLTGHGGIDKLEYREDIPVPQPADDEVLVEVGACGMNNTDINTRTGWYDAAVQTEVSEDLGLHGRGDNPGSSWNKDTVDFPRIQGAAVVGRIVRTGRNVGEPRIGQRVIIDPSVRDTDQPVRAQLAQYLGSERDGGFAEYVAVPAVNAHAITSPLSDAELATFPCSYDTAEEMLARTNLCAGETVVITGAAGGVGTALIQLARVRRARVIAIAGAQKEDRLRALGADLFIARESQNLAATVALHVGERAVDVVVDVVGGALFPGLLKMLRRGGRYATAGAIGGPVAQMDLRELIYKDLEMHGITNPSPQTFARVVDLIERGELTPQLDGQYGLEALPQAQAQLLKRTHVGKLVIVP